MWKRNFIFVAVLLLASSMAWAQTRATISGTIADETGALLPGVEVTVTNLDTGISRSVLSNDEGSYIALDVSLGNYEIEASLPGFQTAVRTGIQLTLGREAVVQMILRVGEIAERVTVTGEAPLVETTQSVLADLVEQRTITELPLNGRSFTDLALLQAGAMVRNGHRNTNFNPISGGGTRASIGGARPKQNAYILDGQNAKDAFGNTPGSAAGTVLGVETVREFSVLTNAYSAEFAGAGGVISAVTKSGTNNIHGSVFWFHRNDNLDAVDYNAKIANAEQPEFRRHQFGFTVGGPIVTDQTFFFGSYEGLRQVLGRSRTVRTLSNAARNETIIVDEGRIYPIADAVRPYLALYDVPNGIDLGDGTADFNFATSDPTRENYFLAKVDHTFSDTDSIDVRYSVDDAVAELYYSGGDVARWERHPDTRRQLFNTTWRRILSPSLFNSASASFNRSFGGLPNNQKNEGISALNFLPDRLFGQISGNTVSRIGTDAAGGGDRLSILNLFEYADTVSYTVGRHSIKFGGKVSRTHLNGLSGSRLHGRMAFRGLERFLDADPTRFEFLNPVGAGSSIRGYRQTMVSTFIQDDFKLRPGLTLNGGVRWEVLNVPTEVGNRIANVKNELTDIDPYIPDQAAGEPWFENTSWTNIGPRIGFAWDPLGTGETSIRSGYGIFFQPHTSANWWLQGYQNMPFFKRFVLYPADLADPTGFFPNAYTNFLNEGLDEELAGTMAPMEFSGPTPYLMQFHFTIQHQLTSDSVFSVSYAGNRGTKLGRLKSTNSHTFATCPCADDPNTAGFDESTLASGMKYWPLASSAAYPDGGEFINPNFIDMEYRNWDGNSWYNSLQTRFSKRFGGGYSLQANYTFSRNLDFTSGIAGGDVGGSAAATQDPFDQVRSKGLSGFHVKHNFTTNFTADIPTGQISGPALHFLGGWSVGGIVTASSGSARNITASGSLDQAQIGVSRGTEQAPDLIPGKDHNPVLDGWEQSRFYWSSDSFERQQAGTLGNLGRNVGVGPGYFNVDFSLKRDFALAEETRIQFRGEFFNMMNRVNFGNPSGSILTGSGRISSSFGRVSGGASARQVQLGLKLIF